VPEHLLLIALGPVQDFIMTARSSGDLWLGSTLLSECSKAAATAIFLETKTLDSLIFPAPKHADQFEPIEMGNNLNVANVIFARVPSDPSIIAGKAREAVRATLDRHWQKARRNLHTLHDGTAKIQIEELIEWYWASTPLTNDYQGSRNRVYALLNARKSCRDFQAIQGTAHPKSSLDGARESVIPEEQYPPPGTSQPERDRQAKLLFARYGVRIGERLCAVGLLKRRAMRGRTRPNFKSTSHMAVTPLLERAITGNLELARRKLEELKTLVNETNADFLEEINLQTPHPLIDNLDGRVLLPERLREAFADREQLQQAQTLVREMLNAAYNGPENSKPRQWEAPTYYALLHADGDRMGKAIDKQTTPSAHRGLSSVLAGFAEQAKVIIQNHGGCPVFVGGDDVLAYLPVHMALACADELASTFQHTLEDYKFQEEGKTYSPTLSAGLAIAHYLDPLQDTLEAAKSAEKTAKKTRNALAITLLKRSGAPITISGHWEQIIPRLTAFRELHRHDLFPDGAAYELRELARTLEPIGITETASEPTWMTEAASLEAKRILKRKRPKQGTRPMAHNIIQQVQDHIEQTSIRTIANELIVARAFADASEIAEPTPSEEPSA
jgi:CRISPR-associated protein Cmr2